MTAGEKRVFWRGAAAMALTLAVSNYLVRFPLGDWLTFAALTYPAAFLITDCANRIAGAAAARRVVFAGFVFGVPLSFVFGGALAGDFAGAARIAAASGAAFFCAQSVDVAVFDRLRRRGEWWRAPAFSSLPASALDTVLFFSLAFAGTDAPWTTLAAGDFAVKLAMIWILLPPYRLLTRRAAALS